MAEDKVQISFDEDCRIRVLDPEVFKHSEELEEDCKGFVSKIQVCYVSQLAAFLWYNSYGGVRS
jgi:Intraflagellar transport complex B, subunit 20